MYSEVFVAPGRVNQRACGMQLKSVYVYLHSENLGHSFAQNGSNLGHPECSLLMQPDRFGTVSKTCGNIVEQSVTCFVIIFIIMPIPFSILTN